MAVCEWCNHEMLTADGCTNNCTVQFADGQIMQSVPYLVDWITPSDPDYHCYERCHDCNVKIGERHHPGCDMECCPRCEGQLIRCNCDVDAGTES